MKTCISCKYHDDEYGNNCCHPAVMKPDPVRGSLMVMCDDARKKGNCGPPGKLWTPTLMARLFRECA